jgi:TnpA family transposase
MYIGVQNGCKCYRGTLAFRTYVLQQQKPRNTAKRTGVAKLTSFATWRKAMDNPGKRLVILGLDEIDVLYGHPRFTQEERDEYFVLSAEEKAALGQLHSLKSKVFFILQLGYFKARHMFFVFGLGDVKEDAVYIRQRYSPDFDDTDAEIAKGTRLKQQRMILELCKYRNANTVMRKKLKARARLAAAVCGKPIYVFRELMHYLAEERVVAPGYSVMQNIVGGALAYEQRRLAGIVTEQVGPSAKAALERLLEDAQGLYEITRLKRDPRDFSNQEIRREVERGNQMRELYEMSQKLLPRLKISNENIRYYASLVDYYSVYKLRQLSEPVVCVYLLCFIQHRYQKLHDNLFQSLLHHIRKHGDDARAAAKELVYNVRVTTNDDMPKGGQILRLFTDGRIDGSTPFEKVRQKAFAVLPAARLDAVAECLATNARFDETAFQWQHIDKAAQRFKLSLRPILQGVEFAALAADDPLIEAVCFLKEASRSGKALGAYKEQDIPLRWVPEKMRRYLYERDECNRKRLLPDRYEFLLYRQLRHGVEAGDIFCRDSVRFRSMNDDLLGEELWRKNKGKLIAEAGLDILQQPIETHLAELKEQLETRLAEVNRRIATEENKYFKRQANGRWTLEYPGNSEAPNHLFFDQLPQGDIHSIMHFANRQCRFMDAFTHVLGRYARQSPDIPALGACLVAWGTNMGIARMGQISDIGYHTLVSTSDNFLHPETLREANDIVSNAIARLPIFRHYDIGEVVHSSSDGQKFETSVRTFNARHSSKYFGLMKGIVPYTAVANHVPINAYNIGADEHESHFVFDVLFNNSTDIQPEIHSTDTHGTNEVNFALLHMFGYQFAPRYKDLYDKVRTSLMAFHHPNHYGDAILKPVRKIRESDIIREWDECARIFMSLARKETTQSTIVRKLSAHARNNRTKRALWEYDSIHRSLYLLNYIDCPSLRQSVQKAVNRGENYHQLRRAVSFASFGKLRFKTEYEQDLWSECSRLIANCIIFYNASILSRLLEYQERTEDTQGAAVTKKISPIAWQHINLHGRYEFQKQPDPLNVDAIIRELTEIPSDRGNALAA